MTVLWTSGISICTGGTGVMVPSSSFTRSPIVAPIFALACRKLSDSFSCSQKAFIMYLHVCNRILSVSSWVTYDNTAPSFLFHSLCVLGSEWVKYIYIHLCMYGTLVVCFVPCTLSNNFMACLVGSELWLTFTWLSTAKLFKATASPTKLAISSGH